MSLPRVVLSETEENWKYRFKKKVHNSFIYNFIEKLSIHVHQSKIYRRIEC